MQIPLLSLMVVMDPPEGQQYVSAPHRAVLAWPKHTLLMHAPVPAAAAPIVLPVFTPEEIERMAQKEHARWNMERLRSGWRYAAVKDAAAKRTPWLVPWDALPDEIKQYDRDAVLNYARFLKEAGLVLTRTARV